MQVHNMLGFPDTGCCSSKVGGHQQGSTIQDMCVTMNPNYMTAHFILWVSLFSIQKSSDLGNIVNKLENIALQDILKCWACTESPLKSAIDLDRGKCEGFPTMKLKPGNAVTSCLWGCLFSLEINCYL